MRDFKSKKQLLRLMLKDSSERMLAVVAMTLMSMLLEEQVLISVVKSLLLSSPSKVSQEDQD
jgi:hypothetical protein